MSVYFIRAGRYFKIGATDDAQRRFQNLHKSGTRYTFPADASWLLEDRDLYRVVDGGKSEERAIHLALDEFAVGLEWFLDEAPLRAFIDSLPDELDRDGSLYDLPRVSRVGGWCEVEYNEVQHGRALRETARYMARRSA